MTPLHLYVTDGHADAGWNTAGTTHRVTAMAQGEDDTSADFYSLQAAMQAADNTRKAGWLAGRTVTIHDLTGRG